MSGTPTPLTPSQLNYAQTAQWKEALKQALADLRVAAPGIIKEFDAVKQVATVQIAVRERVRTIQGPQDVAIEPIYNVPVVLPRAGGFSLTLPIAAGDECLLVFSDMCIDLWWSRGGVQNQFETRRHDLTDCFCIPGPWSQPRVLSSYSTSSAQLRSDDGTVIVDVAEAGVTVTAPKLQITTSGEVTADATGNVNLEGQDVIISSSAGDIDLTATGGNVNLSGTKYSIAGLSQYTSNALAIAGGLTVGQLFRDGSDPSHVCVVH